MKHSIAAAKACGIEARSAPTFPTKYNSVVWCCSNQSRQVLEEHVKMCESV